MTGSGEEPCRRRAPSRSCRVDAGRLRRCPPGRVGCRRSRANSSSVRSGRGVLAVQREQDGKPRPVEPARVQQPREELVGFVLLADAEKCADADARVAGPREAIVPVADAAEHFGQRGRWRRDGCAGRRVGEQPQREQAPHDCIAEWDVRVDRLRSRLASAARRPRARPTRRLARREISGSRCATASTSMSGRPGSRVTVTGAARSRCRIGMLVSSATASDAPAAHEATRRGVPARGARWPSPSARVELDRHVDGAASARKRRTSKVVGRSRPASSATIPSVSVSRAPSDSQTVSSVAVPGR